VTGAHAALPRLMGRRVWLAIMDNNCPQLYTCKWHPFWVSCFTDSRLDGVLVCFPIKLEATG